MLPRLLLVVDDVALRRRLREAAQGAGLIVIEGEATAPVCGQLEREDAPFAVVSRGLLPPAESVVDSVRALLASDGRREIVVLVDGGDGQLRADLLAAGCAAVLDVDVPEGALEAALVAVVDRLRRSTASEPAPDALRLGDFVTRSPRMQKFMQIAQRVSHSESSLLILGETGVGKERLARAVHAGGPRADQPFVVVNCGAVPETLLESELFGHERGAFTGAVRAHRGHFEMAHGGAIFLDEIGDMPLHLQVKLLRVLQEKEIQRVGGERPVPIDVRVMAATNRDLTGEMRAGRFRADLYYRLGVVTLVIPPLRERREDIRLLAEGYLRDFKRQMRAPAHRFSGEALRAMEAYSWPGNVRELMNAVERAVLLCPEEEVSLADLPDTVCEAWLGRARPQLAAEASAPMSRLDESFFMLPLRDAKQACMAAFERAYLARLLRETGGRIGETARRAGIVPRSLHTKMRELGLRKEDFRAPTGRGPSATVRPEPGTESDDDPQA